jgi:hypothetical protein
MGTNGPRWDREAHYKNKSVKQLQDELEQFRIGYENLRNDKLFSRTTAMPFYETHIEYLRMTIAERIGK